MKYSYKSQDDLVNLMGLLDPNHIRLSMSIVKRTSKEFEEVYSKLTFGEPSLIRESFHSDYLDNIIVLPKNLEKFLPITNYEGILPPGIKRFISDLEKLTELAEKEMVIPLLEIVKEKDYPIKLEKIAIAKPSVEINDEEYDAEIFNYELKDKVYDPKIEKLSSISSFGLDFSPYNLRYSHVNNDNNVIGNCLEIFKKNRGENIITGLYIDINQVDEYKWQSRIMKEGNENFLIMDSDEDLDEEKMVNELKSNGINIELVGDNLD